mmetsp:Transcript_21741/g.45361  ORF Transcript_21741/g.45361 Transcript_21741/m.45361 type:complete len:222 (-) Transcript_21741:6492-7157(-)
MFLCTDSFLRRCQALHRVEGLVGAVSGCFNGFRLTPEGALEVTEAGANQILGANGDFHASVPPPTLRGNGEHLRSGYIRKASARGDNRVLVVHSIQADAHINLAYHPPCGRYAFNGIGSRHRSCHNLDPKFARYGSCVSQVIGDDGDNGSSPQGPEGGSHRVNLDRSVEVKGGYTRRPVETIKTHSNIDAAGDLNLGCYTADLCAAQPPRGDHACNAKPAL